MNEAAPDIVGRVKLFPGVTLPPTGGGVPGEMAARLDRIEGTLESVAAMLTTLLRFVEGREINDLRTLAEHARAL